MEFTIDLASVTISDYRKLGKSSMGDVSGDEILARAAGLSVDQVQALTYDDYRRLLRAFFKRAGEPLADPN
jgi:hypothetical protein